jgi:four helix bundle protein
MTYEEWEAGVPAGIRGDAIWRVQAFRLASYLAAAADADGEPIATQPRLAKAVAQLSAAAGSVAANVAEGYARLSPRDRIRYYEYALGSAAEAKSWYLSLSRSLPPATVEARLATLTSIARLLLKMIRSGRLQSLPTPDPSPPVPPQSPTSTFPVSASPHPPSDPVLSSL